MQQKYFSFELNLAGLSKFHVREFANADLEWVQFVLANRRSRDRLHDYDVVVGPTANDDTMVVINAYLDGLYGEVGGEDALNTLLRNIEAENLPGRFVFQAPKRYPCWFRNGR